ncbi:MAG: hypothetical protein KAG20_01835 [Cocleimonas sp.]|nr:hypothetical protein [Cocleimonas sp.]
MNIFKDLIEKAKEMKRVVDEYYVSTAASFNDPIAMKTEWRPAKRGGSNFATHSLVIIDESRIEFKATSGAKLFYFLFLIVGIGMISFVIFLSIDSAFSKSILFFLVALLFSIAGFLLFYFGTKPIVFDRKKGCFWIGRKPPKMLSPSKKSAFFEQIYALQLISETCHSSASSTHQRNRSYESYELNLVLKDGQRINVVDHGDKQTLRKDTATLAQFLHKPIWDAL